MAATATVRVHPDTHRLLRELSARERRSIPDLLREFVQRAGDEQLLAEHNRVYGRLRTDPAGWDALEGERSEWDATLSDGLEGLD